MNKVEKIWRQVLQNKGNVCFSTNDLLAAGFSWASVNTYFYIKAEPVYRYYEVYDRDEVDLDNIKFKGYIDVSEDNAAIQEYIEQEKRPFDISNDILLSCPTNDWVIIGLKEAGKKEITNNTIPLSLK